MKFQDYITAPGINASLLCAWLDDPLDARDMLAGTLRRPTRSMAEGTLLHSLFLEPRWAERQYHIRPETYPSKRPYGYDDVPWNNNATYCRDWNSQHQDKPIVTRAEFDQARERAKEIRRHPAAKALVKRGGKCEVSMFGDHADYGPIKARFDYIRPDVGLAVDLKTARDVTDYGIAKAIADYRYYVKAAFYQMVAGVNGINLPQFHFVFIRLEPLRINVKRLKDADLDAGRQEIELELPKLKAAMDSGDWPDPSGGEITMAKWGWDRWQARMDEGLTGFDVPEPEETELIGVTP